MNTKRQFICVECQFTTHKRAEIFKHLRELKHKSGVTVNHYVWEEDKQIFVIVTFTMFALAIFAMLVGALS